MLKKITSCICFCLMACLFAAENIPDNRFTGPQISILLGSNPPQGNGIELMQSDESKNEVVTQAGQNGRYEKNCMYFVVRDERFKKGKLPLIKLSITYFDVGKNGVQIQYDASDRTSEKNAGVWTVKRAYIPTNSRKWKTATIIINDAWFGGRCNGADFRFMTKEDEGLTIKSIEITAADQENQKIANERLLKEPLRKNNERFDLNEAQVLGKLKFYDGPSKSGTNRETLTNKVMCGYQGWQNVPGDGSANPWCHYSRHVTFEPGDCCIDYWPDTSELDDDEKCPTPFHKADGSIAYVYTPANPKTVLRHFKWMEDAGIDGVFVQRFASELGTLKKINRHNQVLMNVRAGANANGRTYAVMYDLSGARDLNALVKDWQNLVGKMGIGKDPNDKAYQHHNGKPVVALWGLDANREYCLEIFEKIVDLMKNDPVYGGFAIKLGTCGNWMNDDSPKGKRVRELIKKADILSPWAVGRYSGIEQAATFVQTVNSQEKKWCDTHKIDYMPVVFPGFSWYNMHDGNTPLDAIPRHQGRFLWRQISENKKVGTKMLYVAMFDEIDEGTAIYKCDNNPPVCPGTITKFLNYEGLPSDYYLWLCGQAGSLLNDKIPNTPMPPKRPGLDIKYKPLGKCTLPPGVKEINLVMSNPVKSNGISFQERGVECFNVPVTKNGRPGWRGEPIDDGKAVRKMYLTIDYSEFSGMNNPKMKMELDYFDEGTGTVKVVYDSKQKPWKQAGSFQLQNSKQWKTVKLEIPDALFIQRCNGCDIRIEIPQSTDFVLGGIRLKKF